MPLIGANGGLIGAARTSRRGAAVGVWTPNEQVVYQRQNAWIGDANFESVSLLLHMDGSNGSTTFTDSSKNALAVTANGNAQISTAQSKFGGASGAFDGNGDYLNASSSGFLFGSGDFTVEFWFNASAAFSATAQTFCAVWASGDFAWICQATSSTFSFSVGTGSAFAATVSHSWTAPTTGVWVHAAITRSGTSAKIFINGELKQTTSNSTNILGIGALNIARNPDGNQQYFNGYIDDLRITKGVARYTANFTPPSAPFPDL